MKTKNRDETILNFIDLNAFTEQFEYSFNLIDKICPF